MAKSNLRFCNTLVIVRSEDPYLRNTISFESAFFFTASRKGR